MSFQKDCITHLIICSSEKQIKELLNNPLYHLRNQPYIYVILQQNGTFTIFDIQFYSKRSVKVASFNYESGNVQGGEFKSKALENLQFFSNGSLYG